jgi:hypothetical protein
VPHLLVVLVVAVKTTAVGHHRHRYSHDTHDEEWASGERRDLVMVTLTLVDHW